MRDKTKATDTLLRAPRPDEADALAALGRETFTETFGHLYSAEDLASFLDKSFGPGVQARELVNPDYVLQVAVQDGAFVGFSKIGKNGLPFARDGRAAGELKQLYVRQGLLGAGVGAALMDWALATLRARGAQDVFLSVFSENPRAQRFYQRYGFAKVADYFFMVGNQRDLEFVFRAELDR